MSIRHKPLKNIALPLVMLLMLGGCGTEPEPPVPRSRGQKPVAVETRVVTTQAVALTRERTGRLRARRTTRLHNEEAGRILALPVFEGDAVTAGQRLVRLDDRLLRAELAKAEAERERARQDLARVTRLARRNLASDDQREIAETALKVAEAEVALLRTRLGYTEIRAPFAGVVSERRAEPGDAVSAFTHLLTLIDPGSLVVDVAVSERLLAELDPEAAVEVRIDALGDHPFTGRISRVFPTIDPASGQGRVEVRLDPLPEGALPGQLCRVRLGAPPQQRLVVPMAAVRRDNAGSHVYRVEDGKALRTPVRTGALLGDRVEILDGLAPGTRIVTRGFLGLADGRPVREAGASSDHTP